MSCSRRCKQLGYDDGIEYGITRKYIETRNWGNWEMFREIIQNALDEMHDVSGERPRVYPCRLEFRGAMPVTVIEDNGRGLGIHHLLLGTSEKKAWQRGKFGEGLKLALLAAAHRGINVLIRSGDREIRPTFVTRDIEGVPVDLFCVCYKKGLESISGTRVEIRGLGLCVAYKERFIQGLPKECFRFTIEYGNNVWYDIIDKKCTFNDSFIYVRDIYVSTMKEAEGKPGLYSYNLYNVTIDESRRIPSGGSVRYDMKEVWADVVRKAHTGYPGPYELLKEFLGNVIAECRPGRGPNVPVEVDMYTLDYVSTYYYDTVRKAYKEVVGEDVVLVYDEKLRDYAEAAGLKHIYCPQPIGENLEKILDSVSIIRRLVRESIKQVVKPEDMDHKTRKTVGILEEIGKVLFGPLYPTDYAIVYAVMDPDHHGMTDFDLKTVFLNYLHIQDKCIRQRAWKPCAHWYISTLGHEIAHVAWKVRDKTLQLERVLTYIIGDATTRAIANSNELVRLITELDQTLIEK
jgi:hypothetical protein